MAIKTRNKVSAQFSTASMSDLIFLLLIFFVMTSTLVSPNVIPLLLPNSSSPRPNEPKKNLEVYIDGTFNYFVDARVNPNPVAEDALESAIFEKIGDSENASVVLKSDKTVPVQYVVNVIDAVNKINDKTGKNHKVILATQNK